MTFLSTITKVIQQFFKGASIGTFVPVSVGHIHKTYIVEITHKTITQKVLLQEFSTDVFPSPDIVSKNIAVITDHLINSDYPYEVSLPLRSLENQFYVKIDSQNKQTYWRCFTYIRDGKTYALAPSITFVQSAVNGFALFQKSLSTLNTALIQTPIDGFMDNRARYSSLQQAISENHASRNHLVLDLVEKIESHKSLFDLISDLYCDPQYHRRVTHGDMKLNNILFKGDSADVKAVIDLDTCMVGDYLFDYGDFMRIACSDASEDEKDRSKIQVNLDAVEATFVGLKKANIDLTKTELEALSYCGASLALTVGTRFLTDYLNGDRYFNVSYSDHNYVRAWNQVTLAERFLENEKAITTLRKKIFYE